MKKILPVLIGVSLALTTAAAQSEEQAQQEVRISIESKNLRDALNDWAQQTGYELVSEIKGDFVAQRVEGRLTPQDALESLVQGAPVAYEWLKERVVAVRDTLPTAVRSTHLLNDEGPPFRVAKLTDGAKSAVAGAHGTAAPERSALEPSASQDLRPHLDEVDEIVIVTGSRLRRHADAGDRPVTIYEHADLERLGVTTAGEMLRAIPQNQGTASTSALTTLGASHYPNLRGLGEGTTLVLINGQRPSVSAGSLANPAAAAQFNLDVIPSAAIERIEVLRDGASAIYGSDAVGGVINVILRRDYSGAELSAQHSSAESALEEENYSAVIGGQFGRSSILLGATYYDRGSLMGGDRAYSASLDKTALGGANRSFPGSAGPHPANITAMPGDGNLPGLSSTTAAVPAGAPRALTANDFVPTQGESNRLIDYTSFATLVPAHRRSSAFVHADVPLNDSWSADTDIYYSKGRTAFGVGFPFADMTFGAQNPYNPFGVDTLVSFYLVDVPAGGFGITDTEDFGFSGGLTVGIGTAWQIRGGFNLGESQLDEREGAVDPGLVATALVSADRATALNPLFGGRGNSAEVLRSLTFEYLDGHTRTQGRTISLGANGPLLQLPSGSVDVALGAEARQETLDTRTESLFSAAPFFVDQDRDVTAAYVELGIPLARATDANGDWNRLDVSLATRYEHYDDFGGTTNPKIGFVWHPTRYLAFRGTWGTAFQAPSLSQLYSAPSVSAFGPFSPPIFDPILNESYQVSGNFIARGNSRLEPQEANTLSVGLNYEREISGGTFNVSADFYQVDFTDRIRSPSTIQELIELEVLFPELVVRDPASNRITDLVNAPVNVAGVDVSGIDFSVGYAVDLLGGRLDTSIGGTWVNKYDLKLSPISETLHRRSYVGFSNQLKGSFQASYSVAAWSGSAIVWYGDAYQSDQGLRDVRSQTTLDLQLSYDCCRAPRFGVENLKVIFGVVNLFDREPPFYDNPAGLGFDPGEGDPIQRRIYAKLSVSF